MVGIESAITVELKSETPQTCIFVASSYNFNHAFEAAKKRSAVIVQANEQFGVREILITPDDYGHGRGIRFVAVTMRHKSRGGIVPQQLIQLVCGVVIRHMQQHAQTVLHRLVAELTSGAQLVFAAGVEIDFGHVG